MKGKVRVNKEGLMISEYFEINKTVEGWVFFEEKDIIHVEKPVYVPPSEPLSSV